MGDEYTLSGFAEIFTKLTRIHETSTLWTDFLEYIIDYFLLNSKKEMRYWTKKTDTYTDEEKEIFWEMFNYWLKLSQQEINKNGWYDFFGEFYEAYILSQFKAGDKAQFFTPAPVSDLMSSIAEDKELHDGDSIYDPAGGSGRNLLSMHLKYPNSICVSWDIDEQACKMCVCNFLVHGVRGVVVWTDSLSQDYFDSWKVNEQLYESGGISHVVHCHNLMEAYNFLGSKLRSSMFRNVVESKKAGSVQTTLTVGK